MRGRSRHLDGTGLTSLLLNQSLRSLVKSVQVGSIAIGSGSASNTATITSVVLANSVLIMLGNELSATTTPNAARARLALTDSTTITATRNTAAANTNTVEYAVVEFWPGVIKSVQRGTIVLSGVASNTATITAVNTAKSWVLPMGYSTTSSTDGATRVHFCRFTLTDATTVTFRRNDSADGATGAYQVVEFY